MSANQQTMPQNSHAAVDNNSVYSTGLPADKNDPVKLAERRQVYVSINKIINGVSVGELPQLDEVQYIGSELVRLTKAGYIPVEDAQNTFEYLEQNIPVMGQELNFYARQIQSSGLIK